MKKHFKTALLFLTIAFIPLFFYECFSDCHTYNCYDAGKKQTDYSKIRVDDATFASDTINTADTLVMFFSGTIGTDSCYSFGYFQATGAAHQTDLTLWAAHSTVIGNNTPCANATIILNGINYKIPHPAQGNYTVVIHQPDGSQITRNAYIQ